jgi:hypothetical protein
MMSAYGRKTRQILTVLLVLFAALLLLVALTTVASAKAHFEQEIGAAGGGCEGTPEDWTAPHPASDLGRFFTFRRFLHSLFFSILRVGVSHLQWWV